MPTLNGKVVMITGASKGLGRALGLMFAKQGAKLALSARGETALTRFKRELEELGADVLAVVADMSVSRDVERFVAAAEDVDGASFARSILPIGSLFTGGRSACLER